MNPVDFAVTRSFETTQSQARPCLQEIERRLERIKASECRENEMSARTQTKAAQPIQFSSVVQVAEVGENPVESFLGCVRPHVRHLAPEVVRAFQLHPSDHRRRNVYCRHVEAALSKVICILAGAAACIEQPHS